MYERFTDRARKVMQLANQEAQRFNHEFISPFHILLGLIKEGSGVACNVLKNFSIDLRVVRLELEKRVECGPGGDQVVMGKLPHTLAAKSAIDFAIEEAKGLGHNYLGTEHILLGILRSGDEVTIGVFDRLSVKIDGIRDEVVRLLGRSLDDKVKVDSDPDNDILKEIHVGYRATLDRIFKNSTICMLDKVLIMNLCINAGNQEAPNKQG